ncbi:MAG: hypothetical protein Q9222_001298 [Ikaeria aurantiellina]
MPKALSTRDNNSRVAPYPKDKTAKKSSADNKENPGAKKSTSKPKVSKAAASAQATYPDWRSIPLDIVLGEVPCFDDASTVRRKLNARLTSKDVIPGDDSKKKWSKASMAEVMMDLEHQDGEVEYKKMSGGPSANSLTKFLKKSGKMGGGDSPCYYWGYVMCEKLRIWEGGKKTKTREEAEVMFRGGIVREDPDHCYVLATPGNVPPWEMEGRLVKHERMQKCKEELQKLRDQKHGEAKQ